MKHKHFVVLATAVFGALSISASNAGAWTKVGNGGDVVVCTDVDGDQTGELLDVFEAREVYGKKPVLPRIRMNSTQLALALIERLDKLAPARKQMFETYIKNFDEETVFVDYELQDIPDHGFIKIPANCAIRQLVVNACSNAGDSFYDKSGLGWLLNSNNVNSWHKVCLGRYQINRKLWGLLSEDEQALVKTHEAFMRDFRHMGDLDFDFDGPYHPVRYFNALLFTSEIKNYDFARFQKLYTAQGRLSAVEELSDGRLILAYEDHGNSIWSHVVPQIKIEIAQPIGTGPASGVELPARVLLGSSKMNFLGTKSAAGPHVVSVMFDSQSPILRKAHASYGGPELQYSGDVVLSVMIANNWKDRLSFQDLISGNLPQGQQYETGFTLEPACDYDPSTQLRDQVVEAKISSHSQGLVEKEINGVWTRYLEVGYVPYANFKVKNSILDVEILAGERVTERRPFLENVVCSKKPSIAKQVSFKATGRVFYKGRWRTVANSLVIVDLVEMKVELLL